MILSKKYDEIMKNISVTPEMKERILQNINNEKKTPETEKQTAIEKTKIIKFNQYKRQIVTAACLVIAVLTAIVVPDFYKNNDVNENLPTSGSLNQTEPSLNGEVPSEEDTHEDFPTMSGEDLEEPSTSLSENPDSGTSNPLIVAPTENIVDITTMPTPTPSEGNETQPTSLIKPDDSNNNDNNNDGNNGNDNKPTLDIVEYETAQELEEAVGFEVDELLNLPMFDYIEKYSMMNSSIARIVYVKEDSLITIKKSMDNEVNSGDGIEYPTEKTIVVDGFDVTMKGYEKGYVFCEWFNNRYFYSTYIDNQNDDNAIFLSEEDVVELVELINR